MDYSTQAPALGLWTLVLINSAVFILFAFSFFTPQPNRDWKTLGTFSAFIVALFAEMYGFSLTIYLQSGWLGRRLTSVNLLSRDDGHLLHDLLGFKGDPHINQLHIASNLFVMGGFVGLASSWRVLFAAQKQKKLATEGPCARIPRLRSGHDSPPNRRGAGRPAQRSA